MPCWSNLYNRVRKGLVVSCPLHYFHIDCFSIFESLFCKCSHGQIMLFDYISFSLSLCLYTYMVSENLVLSTFKYGLKQYVFDLHIVLNRGHIHNLIYFPHVSPCLSGTSNLVTVTWTLPYFSRNICFSLYDIRHRRVPLF